MKALILDGSLKSDELTGKIAGIIIDKLKSRGWTFDSFILRDAEIARCNGCFGCWIKTPGICVTNDTGRDIARLLAQSNLAFFLSPVTFGGYSSQLKKALDRCICNILPFFKIIDNETHHFSRYDKNPSMVVIGNNTEGDDQTEEFFRTLSCRNALNFLPPYHATMVFKDASNFEVTEEEINGHILRVENLTHE